MNSILWIVDSSFLSIVFRPLILISVVFTIMTVVIIGMVIYSRRGGSDDV